MISSEVARYLNLGPQLECEITEHFKRLRMADSVLSLVEKVFDLIADSPNGCVSRQVIKNMVTKEQYFTALLEKLQSDHRFCSTRKKYFLDVKKIMDDFVCDQLEKTFHLMTNSGHITLIVIKNNVTDALKLQRLLVRDYEKQFFAALHKKLRSDHRFREDKEDFYPSERIAPSSHWICKHTFCELSFKTMTAFQKHLKESKHYDGKITKDVSKLCYMKSTKTGLTKTAVSLPSPNNGLLIARATCQTNRELRIAASVCSPGHGLPIAASASVSVCPANHGLAIAVSSIVCPANHELPIAASVSICQADHELQIVGLTCPPIHGLPVAASAFASVVR